MTVQALINDLQRFPVNAELRFIPSQYCCEGFPEFLGVTPRPLLLPDGTDTGDVEMILVDEVDQSDD